MGVKKDPFLLIGLIAVWAVMALFLIGYVWQSGLFKSEESKKIELKEDLCPQADFSIEDVCIQVISAENIETGEINEGKEIIFSVENENSLAIEGFSLFVDYGDGSDYSVPSLPVSLAGSETGFVTSGFLDSSGEIERIRVFPQIGTEFGNVNCGDIEKIIEKEDIGECIVGL